MALSYAVVRHRALSASPAIAGRRVLYWVDPMHPAYKSDKPGIAPDCGMQLEPVYADENDAGASAAAPAGSIRLDLEQQQLMGVKVVPVELNSGSHRVRLLGRVQAEDTRVYRVNAGVQGWVQETLNDSVGTYVKKDQRLATFYSPDFVAFTNGFLAAGERGTTPMNEFVRGLRYSADRLRALGMSDAQISEIGATRKIPDSIDVVSPTDGFIVSRSISTGLRFDRQAEFYQIADLSQVWIIAEIFENEAQYFRPGTLAQVTVPGQHKAMTARVSNVLPEVDASTRTLKLRLEAANPGFALRPEMFVDVELPVAAPAGLTVPADAIVDFGLNKRVFVDRSNGVFEPREVRTGWQFGDRVQIVSGLKAGERVADGGTFLLDSESRLRAAANGAAASSQHSEDSDEKQATAKNSALVRDPKCGMPIDAAKAAAAGHTLRYRDTTYYFCSEQCKDQFGKDPDRYLTLGHQAAGHAEAGHD